MLLENAETLRIDIGGSELAYRRIGSARGKPIIMLQHCGGAMDDWDPAVVNGLAASRPVYVFNYAGVASSSGPEPGSIALMAEATESFVAAMGFAEVDLLGFSLGSLVAQEVASRANVQVRKLILVGSSTMGGDSSERRPELIAAHGSVDGKLKSFFTASKTSQQAGRASLERMSARKRERDQDRGGAAAATQHSALMAWLSRGGDVAHPLKAINQPVLVLHGKDDVVFSVEGAYRLTDALRNATLIVYPDCGHAALFQAPDMFVAHATLFLDA